MANSGYIDVYVTNWDTLRFNWVQQSQSIANNSTTILWELLLISTKYGQLIISNNRSGAVWIDSGDNITHSVNPSIANNATKVLASGYKTITHNTDGKKTFKYSFYQTFDMTFANAHVGTISGSGIGVLNDIPRNATISTAPNFTDEENPTITFSNPAGTNVTSLKAGFYFKINPDWIPIEHDLTSDYRNSSSYTFSLTDEERYILRSATISSRSIEVIFYVKSTIGGNTVSSCSTPRVFTIVDEYPDLDNAIVEDTGMISNFLTGNDKDTLINGYNYVTLKFNAVTSKCSEIKSKSVTCLGKTYTATNPGDEWDGYFENVEGSEFIFSVTDTRGLTTSKTITKNFVNYFKPTLEVKPTSSINASTNTATINLSVNGRFYNDKFGQKGIKNTLLGKYRYKIDGDPNGYSDWKTFSITSDDNDYIYDVTVDGSFDIGDSIMIQVAISDGVYNSTFDNATGDPTGRTIYKDLPVVIQPIFDYGKNDFRFNVPVYIPSLSVGDISIGGGELIGCGCVYNNVTCSEVQTSDTIGFSDLNHVESGAVNNIFIDNNLMVFDSGTFRVFPKNIVGLVEVEASISGRLGANCYGIWWRGNKNDLPTWVSLLGSSTPTGGRSLTSLGYGDYGGTSHKYIYVIDKNTKFEDTDCFYINPSFSPYGGPFTPNSAGTMSILSVKIYSKRGS